jgi:hypothetical protein
MNLDGAAATHSSGESSFLQIDEFDNPDWDSPRAPTHAELSSKFFTLTKEQYMEETGANGCGTFRLTPSDEKFGMKDTASYWIMGDIFL